MIFGITMLFHYPSCVAAVIRQSYNPNLAVIRIWHLHFRDAINQRLYRRIR